MDFTKGNISKSIFIFSIPIVLGNLFQQMYSLVNSAFVGNFCSIEELAAVGSVYPVVFFITSLILGIGNGGSVLVSHYFGAKDYNKLPQIITTFYLFFIFLGIIICGLSIVFADNIFSFFDMTPQVHYFAKTYFQIYMFGMFFSVVFHSVISILRGLGDSVTGLYFLIPANIINVFLSYLFIVKFHWGVVGSAWASFISQFLSFLSIALFYRKHIREFKRIEFKQELSILKEIIHLGLPTGIQQSIVSLTQVLLLFLVTTFSTNAIAGYSAAVRIESIALLLVLNITQSLTSFVGTNYGAKQYDRCRKGLKASVKIIFLVGLATLLVFVCFPSSLMALFTSDSEVIRIGKEYIVIDGLFWVLFGVMMCFTAYYRGLGYANITMVISFLTLVLVRFPLAWYLSKTSLQILGIWISAPVTWLLTIIIYCLIYRKANTKILLQNKKSKKK